MDSLMRTHTHHAVTWAMNGPLKVNAIYHLLTYIHYTTPNAYAKISTLLCEVFWQMISFKTVQCAVYI